MPLYILFVAVTAISLVISWLKGKVVFALAGVAAVVSSLIFVVQAYRYEELRDGSLDFGGVVYFFLIMVVSVPLALFCLIGAIRLAKPGSRWARSYDTAMLQKIEQRFATSKVKAIDHPGWVEVRAGNAPRRVRAIARTGLGELAVASKEGHQWRGSLETIQIALLGEAFELKSPSARLRFTPDDLEEFGSAVGVTHRSCPFCAEEIKLEVRRHCGRELPKAD